MEDITAAFDLPEEGDKCPVCYPNDVEEWGDYCETCKVVDTLECPKCLTQQPSYTMNGYCAKCTNIPCPGCGDLCASDYMDCHSGLCAGCDCVRYNNACLQAEMSKALAEPM